MSEISLYPAVTDEYLNQLFDTQSRYAPIAGRSTAAERISMLNVLEKTLLAWRPRIQEALKADFAKPPQEVDMVDIYYVLREIRHTRWRLRRWMRSKRVSTPLAFIGSRAYYFYEPKGVCLLISPWNYPLNLTLGPLVSALAAGCTVIVKPSEYIPYSGSVIKELLESIFPSELVAVVEGDADTSQKLLSLPFHHIFFTGSTAVGKVVMAAAAKTLASVTLELGGKCVAVVDVTADLSRTAHRIVQTKFVNAGQTCIAPDYVLAHRDIYDDLLNALRDTVHMFYPTSAQIDAEYSGLVHDKHLEKMQLFLADAVEQGAHIVMGSEIVQGTRKLMPTILSQVPRHARVMQEEIFGPILPVIPYDTAEGAIAYIRSIDRPLALYAFGHRRIAKDLIRQVHAGGSCINHCALHFYNPGLPFGGINHSGIGEAHGFAGFKAFSNLRSVYKQTWRYSPIDWIHPPYSKAKQRLIDAVLKWF